MIFTQEDFKKIEEWLYQRTVKDSAFPLVESISGNETVPVVQNNENKRVILNDLVKRMTELGYLDLVNVMRYSDKKSKISLADAVDIVPINSRKLGLIITFCNEEGNWCIYQFTGVNTKQWNSLEYWEDIIDELVEGLVFFPDEEDLTYVLKEHKKYLKFKNKDYNPEDFSGLGRVILRKEYTGTEACSVDDTDHLTNVLKQEQINKPNTIYIIQYDFDLMGETISVPENSILWFQGGTLNNGNLHLKETTILGTLKLEDIGTATLFGTYAKGTIMKFTEANYQSKTSDYFAEPTTKESSATHEEDPKDDKEFFIGKNTSAYTTVQREELKWWNGTEWIYLLDITDYKELKTIIESLIEKHNTEVSECYKYFKKRCAALESRMTTAENRLTTAEGNINTNRQNIQTNTEDITTLKEDHKKFVTIIDPAAEDTNQAAENIKALGTGYDSLMAVSKTLKDFLTTTDDADSVINKFKEVEAFLKNITEEQTLTGLLTENLNSAKTYTDTEVAKRVLLGENEISEDLYFTLHTNTSSIDRSAGFFLSGGDFQSTAHSYVVISGDIQLQQSTAVQGTKTGISLTENGIKFTESFNEITLPKNSGVLALYSDIPTNYVTTDTEQTITGTKTFSALVTGNAGFTGTNYTVGSTSYEDNNVRHSNIQNSFPDKDGKLALDEDLKTKVSLTGDETIQGVKTFSSYVQAPEFQVTDANGYFEVGTTKYRDDKIENDQFILTLPEKNGTLATTDDLETNITGLSSTYVPINGESTVNGTKTFSETLKAKNVELTDTTNGAYKVGNTSYKDGSIVNNSYTYTLPSSTGTLALISDIVAQDFSITLNKGIDNTEVINNNSTIDLSNLYNGSHIIPRVLAIITVTASSSNITAQVNSGIDSSKFSVQANSIRTTSILRDELSISPSSSYYVNIVGATAFIESLTSSGKSGQVTKGVNNWSGEEARSQGISFRISIPSNTSSSVYIQGIRTSNGNNDSVYYDSTYACGIEKYKVVLFGYLTKA